MKVKCQVCNEKHERDEMVKEVIYNQNKYFHPSCHENWLKEKEFKQKENESWIELFEFVKAVHNFQTLGTGIIEALQNLRHGTVKFRGTVVKKYREGVPYDVILQAYKKSERQIGKIRESKGGDFKSDHAEFMYCFSVVISKVNEVFRQQKTKESQKAITSAEIEVASRSNNEERKFRRTEKTELEDLLDD